MTPPALTAAPEVVVPAAAAVPREESRTAVLPAAPAELRQLGRLLAAALPDVVEALVEVHDDGDVSPTLRERLTPLLDILGIDPIEALVCWDCEGRGWAVFNLDEEQGIDVGDLQRCDSCKAFDCDDTAAEAAREAGLIVSMCEQVASAEYDRWLSATTDRARASVEVTVKRVDTVSQRLVHGWSGHSYEYVQDLDLSCGHHLEGHVGNVIAGTPFQCLRCSAPGSVSDSESRWFRGHSGLIVEVCKAPDESALRGHWCVWTHQASITGGQRAIADDRPTMALAVGCALALLGDGPAEELAREKFEALTGSAS